MTQVDIHALAGAYALDALDDLERVSFQRHVALCDACAQEVAELRETTARLADASWEAPPSTLKRDVMAEIGRTRQVGPAVRPARADREGPAGRNRWRRWTAGAVAAGILAIGAATATYAVQEQRVRQSEQVAAVLDDPDAVIRRVPVRGGGEMSTIVSPSKDAGIVLLSGLTNPDASHAYQLWYLEGDEKTSAGLMAAGSGGGFQFLERVGNAEAVAVTLEPAAGSEQPTTDPLAAVPVR